MAINTNVTKSAVTNSLEFLRKCLSALVHESRVFVGVLVDVVHLIQARNDKNDAHVLVSQIKGKLLGCWRFCVFLVFLLAILLWPTSGKTKSVAYDRFMCGNTTKCSSPAAFAEKLALNYGEFQCSLLQILHSGSGRKPEENVPYWIAANNFIKFTGGNSYEVFTCKNDPHDIYYDFCVETSRHYVDNERLQGGFYIYVGDREYTTVSGSTRRLFCFRELDQATTDELNKIIQKRKTESRARNQKRVEEAKEDSRKRVKAVEDFIEEYVGERFWEAPKQQMKNRIVRMKKKFRYCDMAQLNCTYGGVDKITEIRLFGVLDSEYEYEALKKECATMLKVLDEKFGIRGGAWDSSRYVENIYSYAAEPWLDSVMLMGNKNPKRQCVCVKFQRSGVPPKDGVLKELPPL